MNLPRLLLALLALVALALVGCDGESSFPIGGQARTLQAPVRLRFSAVKATPVPAGVASVRIRASDAHQAEVTGDDPPFPLTLPYQNPLGPVRVPVAARTLQVDFFDAQNVLVGSGTTPVQLTPGVETTVFVPFDDGDPGAAPLTFTFGPAPPTIEQVRLVGTTSDGGTAFTTEFGLAARVGPLSVPVNVTDLRAEFLTVGDLQAATFHRAVQLAANIPQTVPFVYPVTPGPGPVWTGTYVLEMLALSELGGARCIRGAVTSDGQGHITATSLTEHDESGSRAIPSSTGVYSLVSGGDFYFRIDRADGGFLESAAGSAVGGVTPGVHVQGVALLDADGYAGSYTFLKQDAAASAASLNGTYALGGNLQGSALTNQFQATPDFGTVGLDGAGQASEAFLWVGGDRTFVDLDPGSYSLNQGSISMQFNSNLWGEYTMSGVLGTDGTVLMSLDPTAPLLGSQLMFAPSASLQTADLNGSYRLLGTTVETGQCYHAELHFDGAGQVAGSFSYASQEAPGTFQVQSGTYSVSANRLTLSLQLVAANGADDSFAVELTDGGEPQALAASGKTFLVGMGTTGKRGRGCFTLVRSPL